MSPDLPSPAEVEHADWPALKSIAAGLGLNPKGRSGLVRERVLDHLRARAVPAPWSPGRVEQAALLTRLGDAGVAAELWESTITLDAPAPWVGLGTAYLKAGRLEEALKSFDRAVSMGDPSARLHKAHALMAAGRSDAAMAEVEEAIAARPEDARAWAARASLAERSARVPEAFASQQRLADLGRGRAGLARILMKMGRWDEADRALALHLADRPGDAVGWNNRGVCLARLGRWKDALDALRQAASLDPRDAGAQNNLAVALAQAGRVDEALKRFEAARRHSEDPRLLLNQAALQERRRAPAAARELYAKVLEAEPKREEALRGTRRVVPRKRAPPRAPVPARKVEARRRLLGRKERTAPAKKEKTRKGRGKR